MRTAPERTTTSASIVLFGGTDTTLAVAEAVMRAGVRIAGVVSVGESYRISYSSQPVPSARHANLTDWCGRHGVPIFPFTTYDEILGRFDVAKPALGLAAGWYHMVPAPVRQRFPLGCLGFHASLLPKLRGGAPLNWAILSGLRRTGVTLFALGDGVDDGPVYAQQAFAIGARDRIGQLVERANAACVALVRRYLPGILSGRSKPKAQKGKATYGLQRRPEDGAIDWRRPAAEIDRLVRAVGRPYPGAYTHLNGDRIYIWETSVPRRSPEVLGVHGQIARLPGVGGPCVVTGAGVLAVVEATLADGTSATDRLTKSVQKRLTS